MKKEELENFIELNQKFQDKCEEISLRLGAIDRSYGYLDTFEIDGENIIGSGDEYWAYGGHKHHEGKFPLKLIYSSNEEIEEYINSQIS